MEKESELSEITRGFKIINQYRKVLASAEREPMYYATGFNQDGEPYGITENLDPWDAVDAAAKELGRNQAAIQIMKEHKISVNQVSPEGGTLIFNAEGGYIKSREIPIILKEKGQS